jgi:antitoxin (DNA-binding transcriptional repressor) of toxin-antitoxin stability system
MRTSCNMPCGRVSASYSMAEARGLHQLLTAVMAGNDVRVLARGKVVASLARKARAAAARADALELDRARWEARQRLPLEERRVAMLRHARVTGSARKQAERERHEELVYAQIANGVRFNRDLVGPGLSLARVIRTTRRLAERGLIECRFGSGPSIGWRVVARQSAESGAVAC